MQFNAKPFYSKWGSKTVVTDRFYPKKQSELNFLVQFKTFLIMANNSYLKLDQK